MKTVFLLAHWVMLYCSLTFGQDIEPSKQARRTELLKRIFKVSLVPIDPGVAAIPQRTTGYKIVFPDSAMRENKRHLEERASNAVMVMTVIGMIDSAATDSVTIELYGPSDQRPTFHKRFSVSSVLAKYKNPADKVAGLFNLCPYSNKVDQRKNSVGASITPSIDLYQPGEDFGYIGLSYSLIITKFFDQMQGNIQTINLSWSDPAGHQIKQSFSVSDNSYKALENSFL